MNFPMHTPAGDGLRRDVFQLEACATPAQFKLVLLKYKTKLYTVRSHHSEANATETEFYTVYINNSFAKQSPDADKPARRLQRSLKVIENTIFDSAPMTSY